MDFKEWVKDEVESFCHHPTLNEIHKQLEHIMSALTNLQAAVAAAVAKIQELEVAAAAQAAQVASAAAAAAAATADADVEAQVAILNQAVTPTITPGA